MKRQLQIFSLLIIAILIVQIALPWAVISWNKFSFKQAAAEHYQAQHAIVFSAADVYHSNQFHVFTGENEFIYQGKLYDIVDEKTEKGITLVHAVSDEMEEEFLANLAQEDCTEDEEILSAITAFVAMPVISSFRLHCFSFQKSSTPWSNQYQFSLVNNIIHPPDVLS